MKEITNNGRPQFGCGYKKCARCYWCDNCPLFDMDEEEIQEMKEEGNVNPNDFANFDNVKGYFTNYCRYFTPFDDDEIAIIGYEKALKERADDYQQLLDEFDD